MDNQGPNPQSLIPPQAVAAAVRRGGDPNQMFQQNPMASNMTSDAMGADPSLMPPPQAGSQAQNPMLPPQPDPQAGMQQPQNGLPGQPQPLDQSQMILDTLADRLAHHSKITEKTIAVLSKMIEAGLPIDQSQQQSPNGQ